MVLNHPTVNLVCHKASLLPAQKENLKSNFKKGFVLKEKQNCNYAAAFPVQFIMGGMELKQKEI